MMKNLLLLPALMLGCALDTSTRESLICTVQDQANGTCPGQEGCVPLDSCVDANLQDGSCCIRYGHPASPVFQGATCGNSPVGTPYCGSNNTYLGGTLFQVTCTTTTYWVPDANGNMQQVKYVDCHKD